MKPEDVFGIGKNGNEFSWSQWSVTRVRHCTSPRRSPLHANQQNASGSQSHKLDPAAKWIFSEIPLRGGRQSHRNEESHAHILCWNKKVCRGRCLKPWFQYEPLLDKSVTVSVVFVPRVRITQLSPCRPHLEEKAKNMTKNRHCRGPRSAPPEKGTTTLWLIGNNRLFPQRMQWIILFCQAREGRKLPQGIEPNSLFSSLQKKKGKKKKAYKVLSACCILYYWSPDNWLCLGGSLLDMPRLGSGRRYSSKLSLPSRGTVRQRFSDLKRHGEIEIALKGGKVSFGSVIPIGYATQPCLFSTDGGITRWRSVPSSITGRSLPAGLLLLWSGCRFAASARLPKFCGTIKLLFHNKEQ